MLKLRLTVMALAMFCLSGAVMAADKKASDKVVVFNLQGAILNTDVAKKRIKTLKDNPEFVKMQATFDGLKADLQSLTKEAENNGMTWSNEQLVEHRKKVEYKRADLELAGKKLQAEQSAAVQRIMKELAPKAEDILNQLITAEGIGLVLDSKVAYYAGNAFNITAKVTDKLNQAK